MLLLTYFVFASKYPLSITNTYNVTKVAINEDLETIKQFSKLLTQDTLMVVSGLRSQQSQGRSQNSYTSCQSPSQKLLSNAVLLHLEQIVKLKELLQLRKYLHQDMAGTTRHAMNAQMKSLVINLPTSVQRAMKRKPPYSEVDVVHAGTKCKFVLWDKESEELLEVSAAHMRETMFKVGIFDPLDFPLALDKLLDQELAFKVKWQPDWTNCSVIMLVKDKPVVNQLKPEWVAATTVNSHQLCPL
ncbi:uncharacterized protein LOC131662249 isoform X2 [Vicia villosa]|uniref:uncharacterized protein LOC131662249 isoform X2 n=1 Tax=Vicia villosa TaxID=3911 RepID=UPI00273BD741|nr:uncharacterized protein LOC131662249 isoform X2 [Vicia villosa]